MIPAAIVHPDKTITPIFRAQSITLGSVQYPAKIFDLWKPAQLKAIGIYPLVPQAAPDQWHVAGTPTYKLVAGKVVESRTDTEIDLASAKTMKQSEIDMDFEQQVQTLVAGYPQAERESWTVQEAEADAYIADNTAAVPMLNGLSKARGVPVSMIATRIKSNAAMFKGASSALIGQRQKRSYLNSAATTLAEVIAA